MSCLTVIGPLTVIGLVTFAAAAAISAIVPVLVEIQERRRRAVLQPRRAPAFRPVIIQGGRSETVAENAAAPAEIPASRIA